VRDWIHIHSHSGLTGHSLMRAIVREVAEMHGLRPDDIMARDKRDRIAAARLEAYHHIQSTGRFSYPAIGKFFGRDHTTIVTGVQRHRARALAGQEAA